VSVSRPEGEATDKTAAEGAAGVTSRSEAAAYPEGMGGKGEVTPNAGEFAPTDAVIYRFSGATDDGAQGAGGIEATSVTCTNFGAVSVTVEVQILNYDGTLYSGSVNANPSNTYTFSTQSTALFFDDVIIGGSPGTPAIFQGSGIVVSGGMDVICTAQVLDPTGYPPVYLSAVELVRE
jgi:hypothetical protein